MGLEGPRHICIALELKCFVRFTNFYNLFAAQSIIPSIAVLKCYLYLRSNAAVQPQHKSQLSGSSALRVSPEAATKSAGNPSPTYPTLMFDPDLKTTL
jgi:hypothetical protein